MIAAKTLIVCSLAYIGLLFGIAYYGDRMARMGRSITSNPYIYALSMAVYCTAWTFYGSVGSAVASGPNFLTIYIGPTLMIALGWFVLRKIIRISKTQHITSIADFIASRYGKSPTLGGVVSIMAVIGIIPYISIQLKSISNSFNLMIGQSDTLGKVAILNDTAFFIALILALFSILFGSGHVDVTEVARTVIDFGPAGLATQTWLDDPHVRVHETHIDRETVIIVGVGRDYLGGRHLPDLVGREQGEQYLVNPLGYGTAYHFNSSN